MDNLFLETGNPILLLCLFLSVYYIRASERERDSSFCLFSSTTKRRTVTQLSSRLTFSFLGGCVAGDNNSPPKTGGGMQPTSSNSFKKKMMKKKKLFSLHLEASVAYWEVRFFSFSFSFLLSDQINRRALIRATAATTAYTRLCHNAKQGLGGAEGSVFLLLSLMILMRSDRPDAAVVRTFSLTRFLFFFFFVFLIVRHKDAYKQHTHDFVVWCSVFF